MDNKLKRAAKRKGQAMVPRAPSKGQAVAVGTVPRARVPARVRAAAVPPAQRAFSGEHTKGVGGGWYVNTDPQSPRYKQRFKINAQGGHVYASGAVVHGRNKYNSGNPLANAARRRHARKPQRSKATWS